MSKSHVLAIVCALVATLVASVFVYASAAQEFKKNSQQYRGTGSY